jgi:enoyl-CoA hydratase/carnithine racemase
MDGFATIQFEKRDGIGSVTLNRPRALNSYNTRMRDDLFAVLNAIRDDDEIRVAIIKGAEGKAFCAGADLSEFLTAPPPVSARRIRFERDVWALLLSIPQPLIAALHGYVLGSGLEIALCCDIRIAAEDTCFGLPEVGLGIIPAAGGTQTLPRTVGVGQALPMLLSDRRIDAREAYRLRLVNRVVPRAKLYGAAVEMARTLAQECPLAVRLAKQAVTRGMDLDLQQGLELERRLARKLARMSAADPVDQPA